MSWGGSDWPRTGRLKPTRRGVGSGPRPVGGGLGIQLPAPPRPIAIPTNCGQFDSLISSSPLFSSQIRVCFPHFLKNLSPTGGILVNSGPLYSFLPSFPHIPLLIPLPSRCLLHHLSLLLLCEDPGRRYCYLPVSSPSGSLLLWSFSLCR